MCIHVYTCTYIMYTCVYIYIYTYVYLFVYIQICLCIQIHIYMYTHTHTHTHTHIHRRYQRSRKTRGWQRRMQVRNPRNSNLASCSFALVHSGAMRSYTHKYVYIVKKNGQHGSCALYVETICIYAYRSCVVQLRAHALRCNALVHIHICVQCAKVCQHGTCLLYIDACMYLCIYTYIYIFTYIYIYIHMYTYIHIYINLCIHVHLRSRSWVQTRRRVYILCILYVRKESSHQTMCTVYMHTNKQTYTNECVYTNTITRAPVRIFARV